MSLRPAQLNLSYDHLPTRKVETIMDECFLADPRKDQSEAGIKPVVVDSADVDLSGHGMKSDVPRPVITEATRRLSWRRRQARSWSRVSSRQAPQA
jgi:hypothetical protein